MAGRGGFVLRCSKHNVEYFLEHFPRVQTNTGKTNIFLKIICICKHFTVENVLRRNKRSLKEICILDTSEKGNLDIHYCFFIIYICFDCKMQYICPRTVFGYKLIYSQLTTTYYVSSNKIIHMYFKSHDLFNESYDFFK